MFCSKCGKQVSDNDMFCSGCGNVLKKSDTTGSNTQSATVVSPEVSEAQRQREANRHAEVLKTNYLAIDTMSKNLWLILEGITNIIAGFTLLIKSGSDDLYRVSDLLNIYRMAGIVFAIGGAVILIIGVILSVASNDIFKSEVGNKIMAKAIPAMVTGIVLIIFISLLINMDKMHYSFVENKHIFVLRAIGVGFLIASVVQFIVGAVGLSSVRTYVDSSSSLSYSSDGVKSNFWICPKCGKENAMFVGTCGCGAVKDSSGNQMAEWKCPECGKTNSLNIRYCACGQERGK